MRIDKQIDFDWSHASPIAGVSQTDFSVRWTGTIAVPKAGDYVFGAHIGYCSECADKTDKDSVQVMLDGQTVSATPPDKGHGWDETTPQMHLKFADTNPHKITIEYTHHSVDMPSVMTLLWTPPAATLLNEAVDDAKQADVVVAFVGLTSQLEGEEMPVHVRGFSGGDRTLIDLPPVQQSLLHALAATGKPLVVVLENGSALAVNWSAAHADAILEAWYPGELGGTAIADTLAGGNDPGGKLPVTFYTGISQLPAFDNYSMKNRTYRYFTGKPLYQFGYGLSYTHFAFGNLALSSPSVAAGQPLTVDADVKNTGPVGWRRGGRTVHDAAAERPLAEGRTGCVPTRPSFARADTACAVHPVAAADERSRCEGRRGRCPQATIACISAVDSLMRRRRKRMGCRRSSRSPVSRCCRGRQSPSIESLDTPYFT